MKKSHNQIFCVALCLSMSSFAYGADRLVKGALAGGAVGAVAGNGMHGALKGAALGGGVAAITDDGRSGKNAREGAVKGAVVGAVIGGVAGDGMHDALRGAAWGAAGGAIIGHERGNRDDEDHDHERHHGKKDKHRN